MKLRYIIGFCLWLAAYGAYAHDTKEISSLSEKQKLLSLSTPFLLYNKDRSLEFKVLAYRPNRENIALVEMILQAGQKSDLHRHHSAEWIYMIDGALKQIDAGVHNTIKDGQLHIIEPNAETVHEALGTEPSRFLILWHPASELEALVSAGFKVELLTD